MEQKLTDEERKFFEDILAKYEPYDEDDPILMRFDGDDPHPMRAMATMAKKVLEGRLQLNKPK